MFKGIKKRFSSNRPGRNRRLVNGGRDPGEPSPREPPDKGGTKPTSPRQVHPVNQISPVPYARRSLERRSRTVPSGKHSPTPNASGYDRRTDTFCLAPHKELHSMGTPPPAYPTTPNICVTAGKIEFITPPDSTLSSNTSGNCSTLLSSPSLTPSPSPKGELAQRVRSTLPSQKLQQKDSPIRRKNSPKKRTSPGTSQSSESPKSPSSLPVPAPTASGPPCTDSRDDPEKVSLANVIAKKSCNSEGIFQMKEQDIQSESMPVKNESEDELEVLRAENTQVKKQLESLQEQFVKLQEYVKVLEEDEKVCPNEEEEEKKDKLSQFQVLVDRCNTLEQVNAQLQVDSQLQRQQYEKCLDKVASQVVQAILVQKTQQEQCDRLSKRVEDLQKQNLTLSSFIASKGRFQSLNHRRKPPFLPVSMAITNSNSQSLPNTLIKVKADCDTDKLSGATNDCWYNNNNTINNNAKEKCSTSNLNHQLMEGRRVPSDCALPSHGCSSLPQSGSSKKRSLRHQSSADACWYDIIKSHQKGESGLHHNLPHTLGHNQNLSSDSSSIDTEEQSSDSHRRTLPNIEDTTTNSSSSSSGDDFHSFPPSLHDRQQGETSSSTRIPSSATSDPVSYHPSAECSLVSSQCSHPKSASTVNGRPLDISLECLPQTPNHHPQNVVVNFTLVNGIAGPTLPNGLPPATSVSPTAVTSAALLDPSAPKTTRSSPESDNKPGRGETEPKSGDVIVKDEGYSTMSSDVQSEAKDSVVVVTISTVEEERGKSLDGESDTREATPSATPPVTDLSSLKTLEVEKSNNRKNLSLGLATLSVNKDSDATQPEYSDGLRVIYDDEDDNSDIFFVPISDEADKYLRHSFNFPFTEEHVPLQRCSSDSYLYKLFIRFPNGNSQRANKPSTKENTLVSLPVNNQNKMCSYNTYLRRAFRRESLKRGCWKLLNRPVMQGSTHSEGRKSCMDANFEFLSQVFPPSISHPRILSPSYSHAEMEDWSLDLSGEDITTPGGTEPSAAESSAPSHHLSQPSIQEATLELEEDHHDFLWNGATYFKADDNGLSWSYDKEPARAWDLNLVSDKQCRSMISPKSGCSDQPAMWSSSEQLSCCSDIASKCSTDIENFCEQLCNLPELKRISVCSSENGGNESVPSNPKLSEIDSNEDTSELIEDFNVETVFTRDFYRLVKFESTKSLTASSKSLATSEGFLTLEKLKGLESLQDSKTLASVLGFIAEQQKYCNDREVMDENAAFGPMGRKLEETEQDEEACFQMQISEDSQSNNEMENVLDCSRNTEDNVLTSSESLSCLNLDTELPRSFCQSQQCSDGPPKPRRSTSLNLGVRGGRSYRGRGTLPPLPSTHSPPPIPSRSTSRSTLPHLNRHQRPPSTTEIPEESFPSPPPPPDDPYVEPYHAIPMAPPPPVVPPHRAPYPSLPLRSSSIARKSLSTFMKDACASPPVPKRITSRALPAPPPVAVPPRSSSLEGHRPSEHPQTFARFSRPRSLLREATVSNAIHKNQGRQRGSCGDLGPICRNSATLMLELQKMAKAEEEEKSSSGFYSPEATSPGTEVGLGTGWVRVEPVSDLGDPQTRANLLDAMMPSSEGCSTETDEDLAKHVQHTELLKAVQRNRRKRKASRHNLSDPLQVVGWGHHSQRPTILGRQSLFNRFGEEEEQALREFQFLEAFPSQSDIGVGNDPFQPWGATGAPSSRSHANHHEKDDHLPLSTSLYPRLGHCPKPYIRPAPKLKDLRSSEPCDDVHNYPISSVPRIDQEDVCTYLSSSSATADSVNASPCSTHRVLPPPGSPISPHTPSRGHFSPSLKRNEIDSFPTFRKHSRVDSSDNKQPISNPPSERRLGISSRKLSEKDLSVDARQSHFGNTLCQPEVTPVISDCNNLSSLKTNKSKIPTKQDGKLYSIKPQVGEEGELVDTRSLSNVKLTIQKLNSRNESSGNSFNNTSGTKLNSSGNLLQGKPSVANPASPTSTNSCSLIQKTEKNQGSNKQLSCAGGLGCPHPITPPSSLSNSSKRTPKLPGSNLIRRLAAHSSQSRETCSSLPPKGSTSPRGKERGNGLASRLLSSGKGMRSPRLPRFKLGRTKQDPLAETFGAKGLCDSGSSESSDKGFCRLSISDSCAEIFSPGESGDEVFHRIP